VAFLLTTGTSRWLARANDQLLPRWLAQPGTRLSEVHAPRRGPLADLLLARVVTSLLARVTKVDEPQVQCRAIETEHDEPAGERQWCLRFAEKEECLLTLLCTASTVEKWLERDSGRVRHGGLSPRHVALETQLVRLRAELGSVQLSLNDVAHLGCGDVLMLPVGADERVALRAHNGATIAYGSLGRASRQRRALGISDLGVVKI
jgi:flagellar motor switch/type III secretory pathway protein FliN